MEDQTPQEILEEILVDLRWMMSKTRDNWRELEDMEQELNAKLAKGEVTQLYYDIEMTRLRRSREDVRYCLKAIQRQRNIALWKLQELERKD